MLHSLRALIAETFVGWALAINPKGNKLSFQDTITDAYHQRGSFAKELVLKGLHDPHVPGNIADLDGNIRLCNGGKLRVGRVAVSHAQAYEAHKWGWVSVPYTDREGFVDIIRMRA